MSLQDKIASAKPTTFLTDGLSKEEVKQAVDEGRRNMSDLISRQAVLDELKKWDWQDLYLPIHFKQILDDVPSVENRGEWILDESDNSVECNKCLCQIYPNDISYGEPHFCPNCGADMRKAEKPETCKGCLEPCIMYEPDMRACKKKVREVIE